MLIVKSKISTPLEAIMNFSYVLQSTTEGGSPWLMIGGFLVIGVLMYFLMIRPQKKQEKETQNMRDSIQVGDEITTIGGIIGKVISIKEETVMIESGHDRTKIRILKSAISRVDVKAEDSLD